MLLDDVDVSNHFVSGLTTTRASLFVKAVPPHPPRWMGYLAPHVRGGLANLWAASSGAVLIVEAANRVFAITFGQGRHLLNTSAFESDFGLKVVLNTVSPDQLKSVDARTVDDNTLHTRLELSRNSSFSAFGLDVSRDLVRAVTGRPLDQSLAPWLTGADSLGIPTRASVRELPALGKRLLDAYEAEDYKTHFDFIDFLRPEKNPARTQELEGLLIEALQSENLADLHLAAPEPLDWSDMEGFRFTTQPATGPIDSDPRITRYLATTNCEEISPETLRRDKMLAISASSGFAQHSWPILECIVYEVELDGQLFVLSGGDWFRVNLDFKNQVYADIENWTTMIDGLPDADAGTTEDAYNIKAASILDALCLDKQFIYDGGPDRMEICDLLTRTGGFIHVKHRGSSSTLSHLFAQGLNSAERFLQDADFRAKARDVTSTLNQDFAAFFPEPRPSPDAHEISFVVITRSRRATPLTLPFFSVVSLRAAALRLRALGFRVSIAAVNELAAAA